MTATAVRPFRIEVSDDVLDGLRERLCSTRFPGVDDTLAPRCLVASATSDLSTRPVLPGQWQGEPEMRKQIDREGKPPSVYHPRSPKASVERVRALAGIIKLKGPAPSAGFLGQDRAGDADGETPSRARD